MKRVLPWVGRIFFLLFTLAVFVFLLSLSWSALYLVFPGQIVNQLFGLANFDIAALAWLLAYISVSRGMVQRALCLVMFTVSMVGVLAIVAIEIGVSTETMTTDSVMLPLAIAMTVLTFGHVLAIYIYHLFDTDVQAQIEEQVNVDETIAQAEKDAAESLNVLRPEMARTLAADRVASAYRQLGLSHPVYNSPTVIDAQVKDVPALPAPVPAETVKATKAAESAGWLPLFTRKKKKYEASTVAVALDVKPEQLARRKYPAPARLRAPMSDPSTRIEAAAAIEREKASPVPERDDKLPLQ